MHKKPHLLTRVTQANRKKTRKETYSGKIYTYDFVSLILQKILIDIIMFDLIYK